MNIKKASCLLTVLLLLGAGCAAAGNTGNGPALPTKPNIIFILTDDLGYGDLGVFFQQQRMKANKRNQPFTITPFLDAMAREGAVLEQYCAAPVCAPSRSSLLLGQSQGHANVRDNQFDKALENNYTLGNVLQMAGYKTVAIGKWGLQGNNGKSNDAQKWPAHPLKRGFDEYLGYMRHGDGHEHYPKEGIYRGRKEVYHNYTEISEGLDKCYTGDLFTAYAKDYIRRHIAEKKEVPFFMYLSYDTPHAVLELPTQSYPKDFGLNGGLEWLGKAGKMINTASGTPDSWTDPQYAKATYDHDNNAETAEVPWPDTYKRYATITKRIDNQVQDILALLKDLQIDNNTLVVFTSDNGPSQESYLPQNFVSNEPTFFGSFGPFDGIKRDVWEGGIRVPCIAYWNQTIKPNTFVGRPSISYDWMATFLDAAGLQKPIRSDGVSLLPALTRKGGQHSSNIYIEYFQPGKTPDYEEFDSAHRKRQRNQMQMVRFGDTVAVRYDIKNAGDDFEIYNVRKDPQQITNLATSGKMEKLQTYLKGRVLQMRKTDSAARRPYDNAVIPAAGVKPAIPGLNSYRYQNNLPWIHAVPATIKATKVSECKAFTDAKFNACKLEAYVYVPEDGRYTFNLECKGRAFLKVHDIALIDEDYGYAGGVQSESLFLAKGYHPIQVFYFRPNPSGDNHLQLTWGKSGEKPGPVSSSAYLIQ